MPIGTRGDPLRRYLQQQDRDRFGATRRDPRETKVTMKDERGLYYLPYPQNPQTRMYVVRRPDDVYFRLWNANDPELWEKHEWVPWGAIQKATQMYNSDGPFDPNKAYDIRVAEALLAEDD